MLARPTLYSLGHAALGEFRPMIRAWGLPAAPYNIYIYIYTYIYIYIYREREREIRERDRYR